MNELHILFVCFWLFLMKLKMTLRNASARMKLDVVKFIAFSALKTEEQKNVFLIVHRLVIY